MERPLVVDPLQLSATAEASKANVARFQSASLPRARWQVINSFVPYLLLWVAMVFALAVSYWLMLPLAILAAGFLARIFIIFHDCGHASFFKSKRANIVLFVIAPLYVFAVHHRFAASTAPARERRSVPRVYGCSTCSINSRALIGRGPKIGVTPRRLSRVAHFTSFPESYSGLPAISGFIISIT
jgi:hypothetical protein